VFWDATSHDSAQERPNFREPIPALPVGKQLSFDRCPEAVRESRIDWIVLSMT